MKQRAIMALACVLLAGLAGCGETGTPAQSGTEGIAYLAFSDIDAVCENPALTQAGRDLLSVQGDSLLLSYVVDSAILLTPEEMGGYDHLVMVNPQWVERFGRPDCLQPVELDSLPVGTRDFLNAQMPILTGDGSVLPAGVGLYRCEDGGLFAFPSGVTLGWAKPITAKNPLVILVDDPAQALNSKSCTLPLASSGNILFPDRDRLETAFHESGLEDYGEIQILDIV